MFTLHIRPNFIDFQVWYIEMHQKVSVLLMFALLNKNNNYNYYILEIFPSVL